MLLAFLLFGLSSCEKKNEPSPECGFYVDIDKAYFNNGPDDPFTIQNAVLEGDCLTITVQYGGGCGGAAFTLVDKDVIQYTNPPSRQLRLALKDEDWCEALLTEDRVYDLSPLQVADEAVFNLVLQGWEGELLYSY